MCVRLFWFLSEEEMLQRHSLRELRAGGKKHRQGGEDRTHISSENRDVTVSRTNGRVAREMKSQALVEPV